MVEKADTTSDAGIASKRSMQMPADLPEMPADMLAFAMRSPRVDSAVDAVSLSLSLSLSLFSLSLSFLSLSLSRFKIC